MNSSQGTALTSAQLAWTVDRLHDVLLSLTSLLQPLGPVIARHGADAELWREVLGDLSSAGDGLGVAMHTIDPNAERIDINDPHDDDSRRKPH